MSSVSSISVESADSRIRQFGLYRTIDARTEEFLKLSRKRQIRQGCACAAVSTAITVTVVIVVFFIYEFSLNSETNLESKLKSNWLSLMNDTSEDSSFDLKLHNGNIDGTSVKLLPLLIKAIKKNAFLEKLIEDHSSPSPTYDRTDSTEEDFEKSVFSRNWFKYPTTKLYAIEYKTSPVLYYKHPTKNIEYYTKIRKIRDYQRVFNYVDKMISEKVNLGATKPMMKGEMYTEKPQLKRAMPARTTRKPTTNAYQLKVKSKGIIPTRKTESICRCPKQLGQLLHKILKSIQKLLPEVGLTRTSLFNSARAETIDPISMNMQYIKNQMLNRATATMKNPSIITGNSINNSESEGFNINRLKSDADTESDNYIPYFLNTQFDSALQSTESTSETKTVLDSTKPEDIIKTTTKPMHYINKYKNIIHRQDILRKKSSLTESNSYHGALKQNSREKDIKNDFTLTMHVPETAKSTTDYNINFIKTNRNYLDQIDNKRQQMDKIMKPAIVYRKLNKVTDYGFKIPILLNNTTNKVKLINSTFYNKLNKVTNTSRLSINKAVVVDDKLLMNVVKTNEINEFGETEETTTPMSTKIYTPVVYRNLNKVTARKPYSNNMQTNKTLYSLIKNDLKAFMDKQFSKSNKIDSNIEFQQTNEFPQLERSSSINNLKDNNTNKTTQLLLDLGNKLTSVTNHKGNDIKLSKDKLNDAYNNLQEMEIRKETQELLQDYKSAKPKLQVDREKLNSDIVDDDIEIIPGDFQEHTKQPGNIIIYPEKNYTAQNLNYVWENLENNDMSAWTSMISYHRPTYLEIHRNDLKHEEPQDEDYNINSNFYDLNL